MTSKFAAAIAGKLAHRPVIASLYGLEMLHPFLDSRAEIALGANVALSEVNQLIAECSAAARFLFINVDNCAGLAPDRRGVDHLSRLGAVGVLSTKSAVIQHANSLGMVTMQKIFVTDRSTLPRSINSIRQSRPHLTQLMPWPVLPRLPGPVLEQLGLFVAAGFVQTRADIEGALACGAVAVSTSDATLW
ncbi:MAG: glycerol-3-phosphate responsive antiterminator [Microbacterium sp.]